MSGLSRLAWARAFALVMVCVLTTAGGAEASATHKSSAPPALTHGASAAPSAPTSPGAGPTLPAGAVAVPSLWTASSRTYKQPQGPYTTIIYGAPVNAKGPEGVWQPSEGAAGSSTAGSSAKPAFSSSPGASQDCPMASNQQTTSLCSSTRDKVGWDVVDTDNTLIQFNLKEVLPADVNVLNAQLTLNLAESSGSSPVSVSAYAVLKPWTTSATWNAYDGTHSWGQGGAEQAGVDYTTTNSDTRVVEGSLGWKSWYPTQIVQEWANGTLENHGLVLQDTTQRQTNRALDFSSSKASSNKPYLKISWFLRTQEDPQNYTMQPFPVDETSTMKVNLASGDLFVTSSDLSYSPSEGPPILIEHNYDSRNREGGTVNPWTSLPKGQPYEDGSFSIGMNRYDYVPFIRKPDGTYLTPRGIDATLCKVNGTTCKANKADLNGATYALTFNSNGNGPMYKAGYKMTFGETGGILSEEDPAGHAITWNFVPGKGIEGITSTVGPRTFKRTLKKLPNGFSEATGAWEDVSAKAKVGYEYNSESNLTTYTDAKGLKTKYVYDPSGELTEITSPSKAVTKLTYDSEHRIIKIVGAEEDGSKGTWEYKYYEVGKAPAPCTASQKGTVVTEIEGNEEPPITYCGNVWDEVEAVSGYPQTGQPGWYPLEDEADGESLRASVNLASGNLLVRSEDVTAEAEDQNLPLVRYYNQQATQTHSVLGSRWRWGTGPSVYVVDYGAMVGVHGPSGYTVVLQRTSTGSYSAPEAYEGTLTKNEGGTYTLANENNPTYEFTSNGVLKSEETEEGNTFTIADKTISGKSVLQTVSPGSGRALEATYDVAPHVIQTTDPASRLRHYEYDGSGRLAVYLNAAGEKAEYEYDSEGHLIKIKMPDGTVETIAYSSGKVSEVIETSSSGEANRVQFSYRSPSSPCNPGSDAGETVVTQGMTGEVETFCYNASGSVTGPKTEREAEEEGSGEPEEVSGETCEEDAEVHKEDCALEEGPPEPPEDLHGRNYGLADSGWLQARGGNEHFDYLKDPHIEALKVHAYRRSVPWNMITEAERQERDPTKKWNPGALARLEDVEEWIERVQAHAEAYVSFDIECSFQKESKKRTEWDDPRELKPEEEAGTADDYTCDQPPTKAQYKAAVLRFLRPVPGPLRSHAALGKVRYFTSLNEPNFAGEVPSEDGTMKTHRKPTYSDTTTVFFEEPKPGERKPVTGAKAAGQYWRALSDLCAKSVRKAEGKEECFVAAGEFTDSEMPNAYNGPGSHYFTEYMHGMGKAPKAWRWAWHAYADGAATQAGKRRNHPNMWWGAFDSFLRRVDKTVKHSEHPEPDIWLTEQGVQFARGGKALRPWFSAGLAENIIDAYVKAGKHGKYQLTNHSSQIKRFFYYAAEGAPGFDSGLLEAATLPEFLNPKVKGEKVKPKRPKAGHPSEPEPGVPREIYRIYKQKTLSP